MTKDMSRRALIETIGSFLTTEANEVIGSVHPKAMPATLTTPAELETWMTAPPEVAQKLQRTLPRGMPKMVVSRAPGSSA